MWWIQDLCSDPDPSSVQTLGKEELQAQFRSTGEVAPRLLILLNHNIASSSVTLVAEVLLLNIIHKVSDISFQISMYRSSQNSLK